MALALQNGTSVEKFEIIEGRAKDERYHMVTVIVIGLATMTALVWTVASTMAREIAAEKRRVALPFQHRLPFTLTDGSEEAPLAA
jgi:hypothetical protein